MRKCDNTHRLMVMEIWCNKKKTTRKDKINKETSIRWGK